METAERNEIIKSAGCFCTLHDKFKLGYKMNDSFWNKLLVFECGKN